MNGQNDALLNQWNALLHVMMGLHAGNTQIVVRVLFTVKVMGRKESNVRILF